MYTKSAKFWAIILLLVMITGCSTNKFIYNNDEIQSVEESRRIKQCIRQDKNIRKGRFVFNNKITGFSIVENKADKRFYVCYNKYVLPIEVTCENLNFKMYKSWDELPKERIFNQISVLTSKENDTTFIKVGVNKFLPDNHYGTVCTFTENGKFQYCIHQGIVYKFDREGKIKTSYLY